MSLDFNNQEWTFRKSRLKYWGDFVKPEHKQGNILVAGLGEFEKALAPDAGFHEIRGNYNSARSMDENSSILVNFRTAYCFEVLEHLINPGELLSVLSWKLHKKHGSLYVSFPTGRPVFLWTDGHFHEFQTKRAEKMFEMCGFEIVRKAKTGIIWRKWYEYFTGIRPFLRLFFPLRCAMYELRAKNG